MKRLNERVEQTMEKLGLEKTDLHAVDKALEYIQKEDHDEKNNNRFAGLRVGNMLLDLNVPLDSNGQIMEVVDVSSDDEIQILDQKVIADEVVGKDKQDQVARPFSELWWLLAADDLKNVEFWADKALRDIKEDIRVRLSETTNAVPVMTQAQLPFEPGVERWNDYQRRYLRERNARLARPNSPVGIVTDQKKRLVDEFKQFQNSVGLFSEAIIDIKMRTSKRAPEDLIDWQPSIQIQDRRALVVPSLLNLSLKVISDNADSLVSLESIPDILRKKLSDILCDTRKINAEYFILLLKGCPEEIRLKNCSFLTDGQFEQSFLSCQTENCKVLQLDLCGQVMFDHALINKLSRSSRSFHCLVIISLKGCFRLTNRGIEVLVRSAQSLLSINLSQCPFLTYEAIICIADYLGSKLRELYIDGCDKIDANMLTPAIKKFIKLEVLSIADIQGVSNKFMCLLVLVCGKSIKELGLKNCLELTDASLKAIGDFCTGLCSLDISNLHEVTDLGMEYLANGCRSIQKLKLSDTRFSDEAVAAFLEISGKSLVELELNRMHKVGPHTAFSLARRSRELLYLDVSWCRKISEKALGLVVNSCSSLKLLKVFNCRQITDIFLNGHSNPQVKIVGLNMGMLMDHLNLLEPEEVFLRYSPLPTSSSYQGF